jgi:hypothetical protein
MPNELDTTANTAETTSEDHYPPTNCNHQITHPRLEDLAEDERETEKDEEKAS